MNRVEDWCRKYQATVQPSCRQYHQQTLPTWDLGDPLGTNTTIKSVPGVEINMPEGKFYAMLEAEARLRELLDPKTFSDKHPADRLWDNYEKECRIRNDCPSVQIAYEKYRNLLILAGGYYD